MENKKKPIILFLANTSHHTGAVADHINAVTACDEFDWIIENPLNCRVLHRLDLSQFDAIGLHYSIRPHQSYYFPKQLYKALMRYKGTKFLFMQDEYQDVNKAQQAILDLGIDVFFTLLRQKYWEAGYPKLKCSKTQLVTVLTGYVPEEFKHKKQKPISERAVDVFYRGREYEYWLGSLTHEKEEIVEGFKQREKEYKLMLDVSLREEDRLYGDKWFEALSNARAVLATESGASVWDFDGAVKKAVIQYTARNKQASFSEVYDNVLKSVDGRIMYSAISPRIYEAIAVGTPLIMFSGYYDGIVKPGIHYMELQKDFSNFKNVIDQLRDLDYLRSMTQQALQDVVLSEQYTFAAFKKVFLGGLKPFMENNMCLKSDSVKSIQLLIRRVKKSNVLLNKYLNFSNEMRFALKNVCFILLDPRFTLLSKYYRIFSGFKRYLAYLWPRILGKHSS